MRSGANAAMSAALSGAVDGIAVETSGSTGAPRTALISSEAVRAAVDASAVRIGAGGRWILALPPERIGGAMVVARALAAGSVPIAIGPGAFTSEIFADAVDRAVRESPGEPVRCSLVPTQVARLMREPAGRDALASLATVLVGGAAAPVNLPASAVRTYGSTETCGGCVYDGVPLPGVRIEVRSDGRIEIAGATLFDGYADGDGSWATERDGVRWLPMPDLGQMRDGALTVLGRADDVIVTGAHKVHPALVEPHLAGLRGVTDAVVVGVPDDEWGHRVVALVVRGDAAADLSLERVRAELAPHVDRWSLPRAVIEVSSLPRVGPGKIDRNAAAALAAST